MEKDKHKHYSVQWIDENSVNHIGPPQAMNPAAVQVVGGPPRPPPPSPNIPAVIPTETGSVFSIGSRTKDLWSTLTGRKQGSKEGELRVQNTRPVRNTKREDLMEMEVTPKEQSISALGVTNGTQLSDGSIATAPNVPLHTFLSSGNDGARAAHDITHMQALYPQEASFPAALETKAQQGDKAYHPFKFEAPMLPPSSFGTSHVNVHYKTNDPMYADQSFSTTHLGVDEFGNPFPPSGTDTVQSKRSSTVYQCNSRCSFPRYKTADSLCTSFSERTMGPATTPATGTRVRSRHGGFKSYFNQRIHSKIREKRCL